MAGRIALPRLASRWIAAVAGTGRGSPRRDRATSAADGVTAGLVRLRANPKTFTVSHNQQAQNKRKTPGEIHERAGFASGRTSDDRKSILAAAASGRIGLLHRLYRPQQHFLRRADHEQGPRLFRLYLWLGRRNFLLQLFSVRDSEQFDPGKGRCAA